MQYADVLALAEPTLAEGERLDAFLATAENVRPESGRRS
jgi:hypothetical protein